MPRNSPTFFISTVSDEFGDLRKRVAKFVDEEKKAHQRSQEHFINSDLLTLPEILSQINDSDIVIHVIGNRKGSPAPLDQVEEVLSSLRPDENGKTFGDRFPDIIALSHDSVPKARRPTYTQWEALLAIFLRKKFIPFHASFKLPYDHLNRKFDGQADELENEQDPHLRSQIEHYIRLKKATGKWPKAMEADDDLYDAIIHSYNRMNDEFTGHSQRVRIQRPVDDRFFSHVMIDTAVAIGRDKEVQTIQDWVSDPATNVAIVTGLGGQGKSTVLRTWLDKYKVKSDWGWEAAFCFRFNEETESDGIDKALTECLKYLDVNPGSDATSRKASVLAEYLRRHRVLLILDGLEPLLDGNTGQGYDFTYASDASSFFSELLAPGICNSCVLISSYWVPNSLKPHVCATHLELATLSAESSLALAHKLNVTDLPTAESNDFRAFYEASGFGNPLLLTLLCCALRDNGDIGGSFRRWSRVVDDAGDDGDWDEEDDPNAVHFRRVLTFLSKQLKNEDPSGGSLKLIEIASVLIKPDPYAIEAIKTLGELRLPTDLLLRGSREWQNAIRRLEKFGLLEGGQESLEMHGRVRRFFSGQFAKRDPAIWRSLNQRLMDHFKERAVNLQNSNRGLEMARFAVFHGCRAGNCVAASEIYEKFLHGKHGETTLDIYPKMGSHAENLAALRPFFDKDWNKLIGLDGDVGGFILNTAALSLRTQGILPKSLHLFHLAQELVKSSGSFDFNLRSLPSDISVSRDNVDVFLKIGTLYGLIAKVCVLQGNLEMAVVEAAQGQRLIEAIRDANVPLNKKQQETFTKYYTAILADHAATQHLSGNPERAATLFDQAAALIEMIPRLKAERMVQHCEYLLDSGEFDRVASVCDEADAFIEQTQEESTPNRLCKREMLLDYAINGYVYARRVAEQADQTFWRLKSTASGDLPNETLIENLDEVMSLLDGRHYLTRRMLKQSQFARRSRLGKVDGDSEMPVFGDLTFAITMLDRIGRLDWLPKVYCVAAMVARLAGIATDDPETGDDWKLRAEDYLNKAERILRPDTNCRWHNTTLKTFTCDFLIEKARHQIAFIGSDGISRRDATDALELAVDVMEACGYGRFATRHLTQHLAQLESCIERNDS